MICEKQKNNAFLKRDLDIKKLNQLSYEYFTILNDKKGFNRFLSSLKNIAWFLLLV